MNPEIPAARRRGLAAVLALALPLLGAAARAQEPSQRPADPVVPAPFERPTLAAVAATPEAPLARAVALAFGATTWTQVAVSTSGPVYDLGRLVGQGFYKRELIELVVLCASAGRPLSVAAEKRRKGRRLREIALDFNVDYEKALDRAALIEEQVDQTYLPLFPERGPRQER